MRIRRAAPRGCVGGLASSRFEEPTPDQTMSGELEAEEGLRLEDNLGFFLTHYFMPMYRKLKGTWEKVTEDEIIENSGDFALEQWVEDGNRALAPADPEAIFMYLLGEGPLEGKHFGEGPPEGINGNFWWRTQLRQALGQTTPAPTEPDA